CQRTGAIGGVKRRPCPNQLTWIGERYRFEHRVVGSSPAQSVGEFDADNVFRSDATAVPDRTLAKKPVLVGMQLDPRHELGGLGKLERDPIFGNIEHTRMVDHLQLSVEAEP